LAVKETLEKFLILVTPQPHLTQSMKRIITRKEEQTTTRWSGGTTIQLTIFPTGSTLQQRNFLYRISTAKVETETSGFTRLPGINRVLVILEGELYLEHVDHYSKTLKQFETDTFPGDWETRSRGKVTDFNLMTSGNTGGTVERIRIGKEEQVGTSLEGTIHTGIYVLQGSININSAQATKTLYPGDFLMIIPDVLQESVTLYPGEDCEFIRVTIQIK
jgi:uncharacterized protein